MAVGDEAIDDFARTVRGLKERSGLSYGALAKRLHMSTSTLHRYCSGAAVPVDYTPVDRLARACGATTAELFELHRAWILADSARNRLRDGGRAATAAGAGPDGAADDGEAGDETASGGGAAPGVRGPADPADPADPAHPADPVTSDGVAGTAPGTPPATTSATTSATTADGQAGRLPLWPLAAGAAVVVLALIVVFGVRAWTSDGPAGSTQDGAATGPATEPATDDSDDATDDATAADRDGTGTEPPPLDWTLRSEVWRTECGHRYLVDRDPAAVPGPPLEQDAESWAEETGAVHGAETIVEATLRTNGNGPVVVEALYVRVEDRDEPLDWPVFTTDFGCGGALSLAAFKVDLDDDRPRAEANDGYDGESDRVLPAPSLPFQVTDSEPLSLRAEASAAECDCRWYLEVEWSSGTDRGIIRLDRAGDPFRTSGSAENQVYGYDGSSWVTDPL
ncbi:MULTISPECIES: helix-turn-helix transcriptional regulator [unclassified Streptomyces]|uniref:helix-turn-helix domain-containing protein n=1 Tax=unclassified Streptomyces TaxID=2593676 RepID=UPI000CD4CDC8|nr:MULTISPECIES: helix-turn-helix transcriptional regulator [unclassified Streptomyces]